MSARHPQRSGARSHRVRPIGEFAKIPEALILAFNAPSIRGLGSTGGFSFKFQDPSGGDFTEFAAVAQEFVAKAVENPAIAAPSDEFSRQAPRGYMPRSTASAPKRWGCRFLKCSIPCRLISAICTSMISSNSVASTACKQRPKPEYRSVRTISARYMCAPMDGTEQTHDSPGLGRDHRVQQRSGSGDTFQRIQYRTRAGRRAPGYSSGQALDALEQMANEMLVPRGYTIDWSGISFQERKAGGQSIMVFALALLMVFLVLAALV